MLKTERKILIVTDGSEEILNQGMRLARNEHSQATVLIDASNAKKLPQEWPMDMRVSTRILTGYSASNIIRVASDEHYDLIVMGQGMRGGFLRRFFGKYRMKNVIDKVACPVFVIGASCESMEHSLLHSLKYETVA